MKKNLIITLITEFSVVMSGFLVYKLAATFFGKDGFAEYALSRRAITFILPLFLVGLGVGLPRYIAYSEHGVDKDKSSSYFISGMFVIGLVGLLGITILTVFREHVSFLVFGDTEHKGIIFPVCVMLMGIIANTTCYSYFRGKIDMGRANVLQLINSGIVPLVGLCASRNLADVFYVTGLSSLGVSSLFLIWALRSSKVVWGDLVPCGKDLVAYGARRVPGDFVMSGLFMMPVTFATHTAGLQEGGYVAFGISMLNMVGAVFAPVGLILLPQASRIVASKDFDVLASYKNKLLKVALCLSITGLVVFQLFAPHILRIYLGEVAGDLVHATKIIMTASVAYTVYVSMRSIVDAFYVKAVNSNNIIICFVLFAVTGYTLTVFNCSYDKIMYLFVVVLHLLALLTIKSINAIKAHA